MAEETVNNKTFKALVEEQKKTTTAIRHQMMSAEERSAEETLEREKGEEKYLKNQERGFKADATRLANLAKSTPTAAEVEETTNETNSYLKSTFSKFLGKGSFLAGTLGGIGKSLKQKVTGGIEGIFKALKAGAFVAFLLGMAKFLESQTFQDIKDKYLPAITKGLNKLGKALKSIADGFFTVETDEFGKETYKFDFLAGVKNVFSMIGNAFTAFGVKLKAGFFDEEGNFQLLAGLKNAAGEFGKLLAVFAVGGVLMSALLPGAFFGTLMVGGKLFGKALGTGGRLALAFGKLFLPMTGLTTSLADTSLGMDGKLKKSKTLGGPFGKGVKGIGKGFGRIFRLLGKRGLAGLIVTAGIGMASQLDLSKAKGVFSDTAKGIGGAFKSLFGVLSDFSAKIASVAAKAAAKLTSVVTKSLANVAKIGAKATKPVTKLSKTALDALRGTGKFAPKKLKVDPSILKAMKSTPKIPANIIPSQTKIKKPKLSAAQRAAFSGTGEFALNPKIISSSAKIIASSVSKSITKKIPLLSIFMGSAFAVDRAMRGEYGKAVLEFLSGAASTIPIAGTAASLAIDAGLLASDLGISFEDAKKIILNRQAEIKTNAPSNAGSSNIFGEFGRGSGYPTNDDKLTTNRGPDDGLRGGNFVNAPVTNINNTSNNSSNTSVMNRTLVMQDPLLRSAINAM